MDAPTCAIAAACATPYVDNERLRCLDCYDSIDKDGDKHKDYGHDRGCREHPATALRSTLRAA